MSMSINKSMKIIDLFETPIQDFEIFDHGKTGGYDNLTDRDMGPITNDMPKIVKAFEKTPFVFNLYVIRNSGVAPNSSFPEDFPPKFRNIINDQENSISFVIVSNFTNKSNYVPLTAWIIAHRIGHGAQFHNTATVFHKMEQMFLQKLKVVHDQMDVGTGQFPAIPSVGSAPMELINKRLTMKSARKNRLTNALDMFPELFAQYLLKGEVTFNMLGNEDDETFKHIQDWCNKSFPAVLESMKGEVFVL